MDYKAEILKKREEISEANRLKEERRLKQEKVFLQERGKLIKRLSWLFEDELVSNYAEGRNCYSPEYDFYFNKKDMVSFCSSRLNVNDLYFGEHFSNISCASILTYNKDLSKIDFFRMKEINGAEPHIVTRQEVFNRLKIKSNGVIVSECGEKIMFDEEKLGL